MARESEIDTLKMLEQVPLAEHSNYRIGGPARYFCEAANEEEIRAAVLFAREQRLPLFVLGGGTNLLIDDNGFTGLVLKVSTMELQFDAEEQIVTVGAGVSVADLLKFTIAHALSGLEWAGGLPGSVGGAIRGNAGAFKGEIKDRIVSVESFDVETLQTISRENSACRFGYRSSIFKEKNGREIILSGKIKLDKGDPQQIAAKIQDKINYRIERHPMEYPNIGSTFKNVDLKLVPKIWSEAVAKVVKVDPFPVVPTAYLISEAGMRGTQHGKAMVSPKHPNFIVNLGGATAVDVKFLIAKVKEAVFDKYGIHLEEEIQLV
ncbi:MAG TPA: UDP-N-acetylmuramate dehydrogenase [Candidatus Acidoferrales bacterium]|nr:UDP-N-acetylmuramate dehydrogenase [Candidatus Acidoferrales bacterium]